MKRIGISFIATTFALFAFAICIYGLFFTSENTIRTQAIYWFCVAVAAAAVPYLKDLAPYIKRVKVGDVEVDLNELKKEVQTVKSEVKKEVQIVRNEVKEIGDVMSKLIRVSQNEASLPEEVREFRQEVFNTYAKNLAKDKPEDKLPRQEFYTRTHLKNAAMNIPELEEALNRLDYYHGPIDENFSLELAQAIEKFQTKNVEGEPDGIAGPITLSKIRELLG